jgi:hypothetical protein
MIPPPTDIFSSVISSSINSGGIPVADCGSVVAPTGIDAFAIERNGNIRKLDDVTRNV